ncbi:MAG: formate dehydrogenase accessory sulfurtransferase FdhD [Actinomycetota bacterium]|nr:formate dehydrogenase accessory sulfurtransferase FdhD [Actinomycetota bacterium]
MVAEAAAAGGGRPTAAVRVLALRGERRLAWPETVVGEEPLEIRVAQPDGRAETVAVTMRTPGHDFELAIGFLRAEGLLGPATMPRAVRYCVDAGERWHNVVTVDLTEPVRIARRRDFTVSASCGVCGSASIDDLAERCDALPPGPVLDPAQLLALPEALRAAQPLFDATGGVHAAGLFDRDGRLLAAREDVGRHNAVDKLLGWCALEAHRPDAAVLCVSGRVSFEIVQKAAVGRFPILIAVSAPSSLAVDTARRLGLTLIAFARGRHANVYAGPERVGAR